MYEMRTIAIDDHVAWSSVSMSVRMYVCQSVKGVTSYTHSLEWRHFDEACYDIAVATCCTYCVSTAL